MKICSFFRKKISYYVEFFLVLCFVLSVSLNVKFYLDNEILKELVAVELNSNKKEIQTIVDDLHEVNKNASNNATHADEYENLKEFECN